MSEGWEFRELVPHDGQRWGQWRFDEKSGGLAYEDGNTSLRIDLSAIDGSARMLDWIFWLNGHDWYTRQDLADLIQAFDEIFYPRANLCPNGCDQHMDAKKYLHVMSGMGKLERKAARVVYGPPARQTVSRCGDLDLSTQDVPKARLVWTGRRVVACSLRRACHG